MQLKVKVKVPKAGLITRESNIKFELYLAFQQVIDQVKKMFIGTQLDFEKPVYFEVKRIAQEIAQVFTENENYNRLNAGTSAHLIYPKIPGGVLVFPNAFGRKTNPGQLYSMPGYKSPDMVFTKGPVLHPGFPARAFDKAIAKKIRLVFKRKIQAALLAGFKS